MRGDDAAVRNAVRRMLPPDAAGTLLEGGFVMEAVRAGDLDPDMEIILIRRKERAEVVRMPSGKERKRWLKAR